MPSGDPAVGSFRVGRAARARGPFAREPTDDGARVVVGGRAQRAPTADCEFERSTPCPAEGARMRVRTLRTRRSRARAAQRKALTSAEQTPCFQRARRLRANPSGVRGPVLRPPCRRQRPLGMAGWRHSPPQRVWAPQRGAARKSPGRLPFFSRPRRAGGRLGRAADEFERWTPCPAEDEVEEGDRGAWAMMFRSRYVTGTTL